MKWSFALALLTTARIDFSPFDAQAIDRGRTEPNLARLAALPEPEGPRTLALLADCTNDVCEPGDAVGDGR